MSKKKKDIDDTDSDENKGSTIYTNDIIIDSMGKYGAVYFPSDVKETIEEIIGCDRQKERLEDFFKALKKYVEFKDQLKRANLTPNLTVLLYGPPGTGKTTLARAYSKQYDIPICVVEADRLVSPLLGDTIKNIRNVVDLAAKISEERGAFVLFFDEIDAIGSERSSTHEVGEIKRAVVSFLQTIDRVNYEGYPLAIIGATNHQQQLDSAIWRRFTFHLSFEFPDFRLRKLIIESFLERIKKASIGIDPMIYSQLNIEYDKLKSLRDNYSKKLGYEISEFDDSVFWKDVEKNEDITGFLKITNGYSGSDLERGTRVALFKAIHTELLSYDILIRSLELVGGTASHVSSYFKKKESSGFSKTIKTSNKKPPEI